MTSPDDVCPVCDSKINRGSQTCDVCGADLSILGSGSKSVFVCPECGNELLEQDTKCPKCGVEFSSQTGSVPDDNVIFECPVCNAQVPSDANRCPSCGVEFLSEDDAAVAEDVPKSVESVPPVEPAAPPDLSEFAFDREPSTPEQVIDEVEQSFSNKSPGAGAPPKGPDENESRLTESVAPAREKSETAFSETVNPPAVSSAGKENAPERGAERERKSRFSLFRGGRRKKEPRGVSQENAAVPPKESLLQADNAGPVGSQPSPSSSPSPGNSMSAALFDAASMRSTVERIREVLKFAGSVSAEITQGKQYLDKALELLQKGSNTEAEKYVKLAKTSIEESIQGYFSERIEIMRKQVEIENFGQERKKFLEMKIRDVATLSKSGQYGEAQAIVKQFQSELSARASQYGEAQEMIGNLEELLNCADELGIDYDGSRMIFNESKKHLATGDWSSALLLAKQSRDSLMKALPSKLSNEMTRAKNEIIDAKISGLQVGDLIAILKQASVTYNDGKYDDALRYISILRKQFDSVRRGSGPAVSV